MVENGALWVAKGGVRETTFQLKGSHSQPLPPVHMQFVLP